MAKDPNFDINVKTGQYSGSGRAQKAVKASSQGASHTPMAGDGGPNAKATQSDQKSFPGDRGANLKQSSNPRTLPTLSDSLTGATNPDRVNPQQRPGLGAKFQRKGQGRQ